MTASPVPEPREDNRDDACQDRPVDKEGTPATLAVILRATALLHANGQSTAMTLVAAKRLSQGLGQAAVIVPGWTTITAYDPERAGAHALTVAVQPTGMNMRRVTALMRIIDEAEHRPLQRAELEHALTAAEALPASRTTVFALACAAGAGALAVIFGADDPRVVALVAGVAGLGGLLRRAVSRLGAGVLGQAFGAALLAGIAGAATAHLGTAADVGLVAVCPAMVLVPGPQILIGAMDLLALRMTLALARLSFSTLVLATIAAGLVLGLYLGGQTLPLTSAAAPVPLGADILAAGVAAACYPVFFSMPYRMLLWPMIVGMAAHALHWWMIDSVHVGLPIAALASCLLVGAILTLIAYRLHIPFAAIGFAAVVALVPGMYVFRMVAGLIALTVAPDQQLLLDIAVDGVTAGATVVCMALGLALPTRVRDSLLDRTRSR